MPTSSRSPLVRRAIELGYELHRGRRHWHAIHSVTGNFAIVPFGSKISSSSLRNVLASLKRGTRAAGAED